MIKINNIQTKSIITKSKLPDADYVINPYVGCPHKCIYCYAEFMKRFSNHIEDEWGDFLDVKICDESIKTSQYENASILFGSVTDAYNPFEKKYEITRKALQPFVDSSVRIDILTKSDLVLRDIDLLKRIPNIRVGISLNTLDDVFRKKEEPFAASVERRIEALKKLHEEKVFTYLFMSPIFPGITDFKAIIDKVSPYVDLFCFENLNLRAAYLPRVMTFIEEQYPEQFPLFNKIYKEKDTSYWEDLSGEISAYCNSLGINFKLYFYHEKIKKV